MDLMTGKISRREAVKLGVVGSAALALPFGFERTARTQAAVDNRIPQQQLLDMQFKTPFVVPPVAKPTKKDRTTDYYNIKMQQVELQVLPAPEFPKTKVFAYNGSVPGPTIVANKGRKMVVRQTNLLPQQSPFGEETTTSVHLHGSGSLPQFDGYANDTTAPNHWKDYAYPNWQPARTLWYHDHGAHHTGQNAYLGLAGMYIIHDKQELGLPIPHGEYDVPMIIGDRIFGTDGQLIWDDGGHSSLFGDVILINGKPWPFMKVEPRKYRFRICNTSIARSFRFALSTGDAFTVIGHDGGLAPAPVSVTELRVGMAERYEIVIDFAKLAGKQVILENLSNPHNVDFASTAQVMRFDVGTKVSDTRWNKIPQTLNPATTDAWSPMNLKESDAKGAPVQLNLHRSEGEWQINNTTWHMIEQGHGGDAPLKHVLANPQVGEVQIWELTNGGTGWFHPLHIHLVDFQILDRNGQAPEPWERGPKDVVYMAEGDVIRIIARFGPHEGRYMLHCHNLVHEDFDMMHQFRVGSDNEKNDPINAAKPQPVRQTTALRTMEAGETVYKSADVEAAVAAADAGTNVGAASADTRVGAADTEPAARTADAEPAATTADAGTDAKTQAKPQAKRDPKGRAQGQDKKAGAKGKGDKKAQGKKN